MEEYFEIAYKEALKANKKGEIPVGAIIVKNNKIIAKSHNNRQKKHNILGHAEILCILKAEKKLKDWRLDGCDMYVTLEPCKMCRTIINESRINNVYFLIKQDFQQKFNEKTTFLQTNDCKNVVNIYEKVLKNFFSKLRNKVIK